MGGATDHVVPRGHFRDTLQLGMDRTLLALTVFLVLHVLSPSCQEECYSDGEVRLSNPYRYSQATDFGSYEYSQGPVEMCYNKSYIGVCAASANINATLGNITCRHLGYYGMWL